MFSQEEYLKALEYASIAHKEQKTPKGMPYVVHITSVAMEVINACEQSKLDIEKANLAIACALLHDVIEEVGIALEEIKEKFGIEIANLVDDMSIRGTTYLNAERETEYLDRIVKEKKAVPIKF